MDPEPVLKRFLVVYDYGMGAGWAYVWAMSPQAITDIYPDLEVLPERPEWWESRRMDDCTPTFVLERLEDEWPVARVLVAGGRARLP